MKPPIYWIAQYLIAAFSMTLILVGAGALKGDTIEAALPGAALWGVISSALFIGARYRQARKNLACSLCKDLK